jgi:poly(A) polymerase
LNALVKDFVYRVGILQGLSEAEARNAGGKIFTFGSYRLGVHGTGKAIQSMDSVTHSKDDDDDDEKKRMMTMTDLNQFETNAIYYSTGADIDTLCVFPKHVERDHFFTIMYDMLNERPEVSELTVEYIYTKRREKIKVYLVYINAI